MTTSDVVIVGAGLSGLATALHLLDLEIANASSITILEGRDRVGGRLYAHEGIDVGGAWCWTATYRELPALAERFDVAAFPQYDTGFNMTDHGHSASRTTRPFDSARMRFDGGAARIADALATYVQAKGVKLELNCTINRISTVHDDAVHIEGLQAGVTKNWTAGTVFLAVPPRLALPPSIAWEPSLPAGLLEAAKATPTWMANTTKVLITYARPFWRELGMSGTAMSEEGGPIHLLFDSSGPDGREGSPHALCGFVFGGGEAEPPVDAVLKPQVLRQLERFFGEDAPSPLSFSSHRWSDQPLTSANGGAAGGGHDAMGNPLLREAFGSSPAGGPPRVWLSGSETNDLHAGLMEGALLSAKRVVDQATEGGALTSRSRNDHNRQQEHASLEIK